MIQRERCPADGTRIWYGTDWLGRLSGVCDACGAKYATYAEPITPPVPPAIRASAEARFRIVADKITAHLAKHPGAQRAHITAALAPIAMHQVERALVRMHVAGMITRARSETSADAISSTERGSGRRQGRRYYLAADAPAPNTQRTTAQRILDVIRDANDPLTVPQMSGVVGAPYYKVRRALDALRSQGLVRHFKALTPSKRRGERQEVFWELTPRNPLDSA